jgi:hypothetical protein
LASSKETMPDKPLITVDGNLLDWTGAKHIYNPGNGVPGYLLYGTVQNETDVIGDDALIFPAKANANTAQLPTITSTLTSAVYDYHIGIITSGDFLTNDQTGDAFPGNAYANNRWRSPLTVEPRRDVMKAPSRTARTDII